MKIYSPYRSERLSKKLSKKAAILLSCEDILLYEGRYWVVLPGFDGECNYVEAWEFLTDQFDTAANLKEMSCGSEWEWVDQKDVVKATPKNVFSWARGGRS